MQKQMLKERKVPAARMEELAKTAIAHRNAKRASKRKERKKRFELECECGGQLALATPEDKLPWRFASPPVDASCTKCRSNFKLAYGTDMFGKHVDTGVELFQPSVLLLGDASPRHTGRGGAGRDLEKYGRELQRLSDPMRCIILYVCEEATSRDDVVTGERTERIYTTTWRRAGAHFEWKKAKTMEWSILRTPRGSLVHRDKNAILNIVVRSGLYSVTLQVDRGERKLQIRPNTAVFTVRKGYSNKMTQ